MSEKTSLRNLLSFRNLVFLNVFNLLVSEGTLERILLANYLWTKKNFLRKKLKLLKNFQGIKYGEILICKTFEITSVTIWEI